MGKTLGAAFVVFVVAWSATGTAYAGDATHMSFQVSGHQVAPAGTLCDFTYRQSFSASITFTAAPNGTFVQNISAHIIHTNVDTGYTLTEHDSETSLSRPGSSDLMVAGVQWHLKAPDGRAVLVKAGVVVVDTETGELVRFTPNSGFDESFAEAICPALGGTPA